MIFMLNILLKIFSLIVFTNGDKFEEEIYGVRYADDCEVCKIVTFELSEILKKSPIFHNVIETGYNIEKTKVSKYATSELRLLEALEKICHNLLEYNIHKERNDWRRFSRGTAQTFQTLEKLVSKGVKVDIGIPKELWSQPSVEITYLKSQCESLIEDYEKDIEDWYFNYQELIGLEDFLCRSRFKKGKLNCLSPIKNTMKNIEEKSEL